MKKQIVSFIACVAILVMTFVPTHAEATPTIAVGNVTADIGEAVSIPITISGNTGICGATLTVNYDEKLVLTSIDKGSALSSLAMTKPGNLSANPFNIVWDGMEADNSNGTLVFLNFTAPNEMGTFNVNVSYDYGDIVDSALSPIEILAQNGTISIGQNGGGNENPEQSDTITISVDSVNANSGGSIDVPVRIANNTGICGATISVNYDNSLTLTKITKGEALSTLAMTKPGNLSLKPFNLVWDGMDADSSNGIIATLTFTVPNATGKYNISLSYDEGDIVNGSLMPVNPLLQNGYIQFGSSFETTVTVAGQSVTLSGQNENGRILVGFYTEQGKMLNLKTFDVSSTINVENVSGATKAKVMWWESVNSMKPVCMAQELNIN